MTHDAPTISVLMTSYNSARWIAPAIESTLSQTYQDFELLITDNCSADETVEIAHDYARRDSRIRVVVNDTNLGQFGNRNQAARLARGGFLKYHDSDDVMYPHCLEVMLGGLTATNADFALSNGRWWPGGPCPMLLTPRMCYQREFLGNGMFSAGPSGAMFRAEAFAALGGFPQMGAGSDHIFWLRACARCNVALVAGDLFWYRIHPSQEFQSPKSAREYALVDGEAWKALHASGCPLHGEELKQAKHNLAWNIAKHIGRELCRRQFGLAWERYRRCGLSAADWLRWLRRPRRTLNAGTPLDADGDFIMPAPGVTLAPHESRTAPAAQ